MLYETMYHMFAKVRYQSNTEKMQNQALTRYKQRREKNIEKMRERRKKLRFEALWHYSNGKMACCECNKQGFRYLNIDHINNDGVEHRKTIEQIHSGTKIFHWLKINNYPEGFQVLCWNCNWLKYLNKMRATTRTRKTRLEKPAYILKLKKEVYKHYSNNMCCVECLENNLDVLTIDHIHNNGSEHRRQIGHSPTTLYFWLRKQEYPEGYQVLCRNCNCSKQFGDI